MNKKIFYHIFLINDWFDIITEQISTLKKSKLYYESEIKIGALYEHNSLGEIDILRDMFKNEPNVEIMFINGNNGLGECNTLEKIYNYVDGYADNTPILYIHAKGVTQMGSIRENPVREWRKMMEYFLIENWEKCVEKIGNSYDCCGINYQTHTAYIKSQHVGIKIFNGNFFWISSNYVKRIDKSILFEHKYSAENWIGSSEHQAFSFYNNPNTIDLYYDINEIYKKENL